MRLYVHYSQPSLLHPIHHAVGFRFAYLFANDVVATGDSFFMINVRKRFREFERKSRISLVRDHVAKYHPDQKQQMEELLQQHKVLAAKKHRDKQGILLLRQTEKLIDDFFEEAVEMYGSSFDRIGMTAFEDVPHEDGFLCQYTDTSNHEREDDTHLPVSRLLRMSVLNEARQELPDCTFLLPIEFMKEKHRPSVIYGPDDTAALDSSNIWLERVLELPNINTLDALELQVLRGQMHKAGTAFREGFDKWLLDANGGNKTAEQRLLYYKEVVRAAAASLAEAADRTKLFEKLRMAAFGGARLEVWVGEVPIQTIWNFYDTAGTIRPETQKALATDDAREYAKRRVPVIALASAGEIGEPDQESLGLPANAAGTLEGNNAANATPVSVRKRIMID